jgi:hypothetical protein
MQTKEASMEQRVAREVAEAEFERMCQARRIDIDMTEMDEEDTASFLDLKRKIMRAMQRGDLVVNEHGDPVYTPPVPGAKPLTFYKATGATFMAMDEGKDRGGITKVVASLTEMTRSVKGEISKLEAPDFQVCSAIASLFLASR